MPSPSKSPHTIFYCLNGEKPRYLEIFPIKIPICRVIYDEKNNLVIGIKENGNPKLINQGDAFEIIKNLSIACENRNNYALGDKSQNQDEAPQLDTNKINQAKETVENAQQAKEIEQKIKETKERLKEQDKEPDALEKAINNILGKNPNKLKGDILSGKINPEFKEICAKIANKAIVNTYKNFQTTTKKIYENVIKLI